MKLIPILLFWKNWNPEVKILFISLITTIFIHIVLIIIGCKQRRFQRFHDVVQRLMDVGINIKEFPPNKLKLWDEAVLNQSEYTAYLVNKRKVSFSFLARFLDDYLIKYHDKILKEKYPDKFENINYYSELKSLVKRLRERKEKDKLMLKVYVIIGLLLLLIALIFLLYNVS